jgi:hypothetical protein
MLQTLYAANQLHASHVFKDVAHLVVIIEHDQFAKAKVTCQ